jgi:hypothetical protein
MGKTPAVGPRGAGGRATPAPGSQLPIISTRAEQLVGIAGANKNVCRSYTSMSTITDRRTLAITFLPAETFAVVPKAARKKSNEFGEALQVRNSAGNEEVPAIEEPDSRVGF